jgi:hypothetical protein
MNTRFLVILALAVSSGVFAQEPRGELGLRYWLSTGETKHSHNAQVLFPGTGNPTSVLTYENLDAHALELHGRLRFAQSWFIKGNLGYGRINTGSFRDEDYFAGQVKFSDTTSSVPEGWLAYGTFDIGRDEWVLRQGRTTLGAFIGYSQWTEYVDAYGARDNLGGGQVISPDVKVISNKLIWRSLRVGLTADLAFATKTRLGIDLAFIPYATLRNEDSHHLRTDPSAPGFLGPVPNIIIEGTGRGVQLDAELRHTVYRRTELGVGFRYWYLKSTDGTRRVNIDFPDLPLVELYSKRTGLMLSLTHNW